MYRIDDTTASSTLPAAPTDNVGVPGFFTGGNPGASPPVKATRLRYWWLNQIQEELCGVVLAAGLSLAKGDFTQLLQALRVLFGGGRLLNVQVFTASGTYTPTPGTNSIIVEALGGGGGGGGATSTTSGQCAAGPGGGAGGWARKRIVGSITSQSITVGAGGVGVVGGNGGNGGTSSFGSIVSATGGNGALVGAPASNSTGALVGQAAGGIGVGGDINAQGGTGKPAWYGPNPTSGEGGASMYGSGAPLTSGLSSGVSAVSRGAGASGGVLTPSSGTNAGGGTGAAGLVIIREYS